MNRRWWPDSVRGWRLVVALVLVVAVVGLVAARAVPRATPTPTAPPQPLPQPTPTPTPAPTRAAAPEASPVATPRPSARLTPMPTPPPAALQSAGWLIYSGQVNGKDGIIRINADGSNRRLLAPGFYAGLVWAPDGAHFAALEQPARNGRPDEVAIFTADGRAVARFALAGAVAAPLAWSPDARHLLCQALPATGGALAPTAWVLGEDGAHEVGVPGGPPTTVLGWAVPGRVALLAYTNPDFSISADNPVSLWTVAADGSDARRETQGAFLPFGLSLDGLTIYALGDDRSIPDSRFGGARGWTQLLAVDRATGAARTIVTADELATRLNFTPAVARWIDTVSLAPDGEQIALVLHSLAVPVTPPGEELALETAVLIVRAADGQLGAWERVVANARPTVFAWNRTPASGLAYTLFSTQTGYRQIHILGQSLTYQPGDTTGDNSEPQWSPDGHWLVYAGPDGLELAAATSPARSVLLAVDGRDPAWSPR
jgi:hypothetical protein